MKKYKPEKIFYKRMKISKFIVDETQIKVGKDYFWLWVVAIKPKDKDILHIHISAERNMFVAEHAFSTFYSKEVRKIPRF
jgi:transposase-like protein